MASKYGFKSVDDITGRPLHSQCSHCQAKASQDLILSFCAGCKLVQYCSAEHQSADWSEHKEACQALRKAIKRVGKGEAAYRKHWGPFADHMFDDKKAVMTIVPDPSAASYLNALYDQIEAKLWIVTHEAIESAIPDMILWLHIGKWEHPRGVKPNVPLCMLVLDRDQEAYDWLKWVSTPKLFAVGRIEDYECVLKGENGLGPIKGSPFMFKLSHKMSQLLFKVKLLFSLCDAARVSLLAPRFAEDILHIIRSHVINDALEKNVEYITTMNEGRSLLPLIELISKQVHDLFQAVDKANEYAFPMLLTPNLIFDVHEPDLGDQACPRRGSEEEAYGTVLRQLSFWVRIPRAHHYAGSWYLSKHAPLKSSKRSKKEYKQDLEQAIDVGFFQLRHKNKLRVVDIKDVQGDFTYDSAARKT